MPAIFVNLGEMRASNKRNNRGPGAGGFDGYGTERAKLSATRHFSFLPPFSRAYILDP